jgi:hypothetical protein
MMTMLLQLLVFLVPFGLLTLALVRYATKRSRLYATPSDMQRGDGSHKDSDPVQPGFGHIIGGL